MLAKKDDNVDRYKERTTMAPPKGAEPVSAVYTDSNGLRHRSKARGLLNASNLPALQNLLKRDPAAYTDEFRAQWNHYESLRRIYAGDLGLGDQAGSAAGAGATASVGAGRGEGQAKASKEHEERFVALLAFVTQLAPSYPELTSPLFSHISSLLVDHHASIGREVRSACVRSLVLLRNREVISSEQLLRTLFPLLLASPSSSLRSLLQRTITTDLRNANAKAKNHQLNRVVQGLLFGVVEVGMPGQHLGGGSNEEAAHLARVGYGKGQLGSSSGGEALWAVRLAAELWRKRIWNDAKTVSLLALACLHPHPRVQSSAIRFFLGDLHSTEAGAGSDEEEDSDQDEPVIPDVNSLKHKRKVNKKTRSGDRKVRAAASVARKRRREAEEKRMDKAADGTDAANAAAINLLYDPQGFAEKLFDELKRGDKRLPLEHKVRMMQLMTRVMSIHKATVLAFYSYIVKYLNPHQTHITLILVSLAQSIHNQTPPSTLLPLVRKLSHNFVHPGVGPEVIAAGINTVREICTRQIWALGSGEETEEGDGEEDRDDDGKKHGANDGKDLLEDLVSYRKSKDKGVAAAARGLMQLYRTENPQMLSRKERGKAGSMALAAGTQRVRGFGEESGVTKGIVGLDLLEKAMEEADSEEEEERDRKAWEEWEQESSDEDSDDSVSSGGWIDVSSDEGGDEGFDVSDSDDDEDTKAAKRRKVDGEDEKTAKKTPLERVKERRLAKREARRRAREGQGATDRASSDGEESDDDADDGEVAGVTEQAQKLAEEEEAISKIATTRILTPADFARLNELRLAKAKEAAATGGAGGTAAKKQVAALEAAMRRHQQSSSAGDASTSILDEYAILGERKKRKADYEERMASIEKGREDRDKFGSKRGKKQKDKMSSTNNEQKKKSKPYQ